MTSIRTQLGDSSPRSHAAPSRGLLRQVLLSCGILASGLYLATDIVGGLSYPGYSFTGQTVSELAAIGAPSESLVVPLFTLYDVLALLFAIGVLREAGRQKALRITGMLLTTHAVIGLAAATQSRFFQVEQRGAGSLAADAPHLVLMGAIVLLLMLAMGFGAFALGRRFRIYSLLSLLVTIGFGVLTTSYAPHIGAGELTPGVGIVERVDVYTPLLWVAMLAAALLRRPSPAATASSP